MNNKIYTCKNEHRYWLEIVPHRYIGFFFFMVFGIGLIYSYSIGKLNLPALIICTILYIGGVIIGYYDSFTIKVIVELEFDEENQEIKCKYLFLNNKTKICIFKYNQFRIVYKIKNMHIFDNKKMKFTLYQPTWDQEEWVELKLKLIEWSKEFDTNLFAEERYIKKSGQIPE